MRASVRQIAKPTDVVPGYFGISPSPKKTPLAPFRCVIASPFSFFFLSIYQIFTYKMVPIYIYIYWEAVHYLQAIHHRYKTTHTLRIPLSEDVQYLEGFFPQHPLRVGGYTTRARPLIGDHILLLFHPSSVQHC